jgi:hypothetical protein
MLPDLRPNLECFESLMAWDEELARLVARHGARIAADRSTRPITGESLGLALLDAAFAAGAPRRTPRRRRRTPRPRPRHRPVAAHGPPPRVSVLRAPLLARPLRRCPPSLRPLRARRPPRPLLTRMTAASLEKLAPASLRLRASAHALGMCSATVVKPPRTLERRCAHTRLRLLKISTVVCVSRARVARAAANAARSRSANRPRRDSRCSDAP